MTDVQPYFKKIMERFANPTIQASLKGFTKSLQFKFTDTADNWLIRTVDGKEAVLTQEMVEKPDILVTMTTDLLAGIMDKKTNPTAAFMQRKIQVKGAMEDLMKLQKIMM
jgi:putative sterol carrier protein